MSSRRVTDAVPRDRLRTIDSRTDGEGELAEQIVAAAYDLDEIDGDELDGDAINPRTDARYEIKSTRPTVGSDYSNEGRFRLWQDQHRSIVAYDAQPDLTGWYVFVRFDESGTPREMRRVEPSTVTQLVDGWNESGHERGARQHKLPLSEVFPDA